MSILKKWKALGTFVRIVAALFLIFTITFTIGCPKINWKNGPPPAYDPDPGTGGGGDGGGGGGGGGCG
jgi:hypothetical protein